MAEELKSDILDYKNLSRSSIAEYDFVIYRSRVHSERIDGIKKIKALFSDNEMSKLIIFETGPTPLAAEDVINTIWESNFSNEELKIISHFYMQGGFNYEKMGILDRMIMKTLSKILSRKKDKSSDEAGFEQDIGSSYDISSREYIAPLIQFVKVQSKVVIGGSRARGTNQQDSDIDMGIYYDESEGFNVTDVDKMVYV
ncbi:nucleotidyltransferase domain-containing protein [Clostridium tertium]|nr:nucleotidyltransferase domain-containing protein [Clostridium tertium]MDB1949419.1 nucleotidyltransferase domain-containing protein [Clostridium tertium]MDB1955979.1 nucleotidyltransferase domain-containing protein [Clostridium tertium]MDB1960192.1 nucleotidyltransferase domain-containing protein [Clostridium tertium]MDB1962560.1 nucleotidyltransferase domain-containing protein [Clostridium tertium]MDB1967124.1 nucleotidyltransferase domain-containing protein [Clostridium tertium]